MPQELNNERVRVQDNRGLEKIGVYERKINQIGLSVAAKGVYLTMLDCESEISLVTLCDIMGISKPTLLKYIDELESAGAVSVVRSDFDPEIGKTPMNVYVINSLEGRSKDFLPGLRGEVKNLDSATTIIPEGFNSLQDELSYTAKLFTEYHNHFGTIPMSITDDIKDDIKEYGDQLCFEAFNEALKTKGRGFGWKYVQSILKRWTLEGRNSAKSQTEQAQSKGYRIEGGVTIYAPPKIDLEDF